MSRNLFVTLPPLITLTQESKRRRAEPSKIRKDCGKVGVPNAKPGSEGRAVLIDCHRRYPAPSCTAALLGIVRAGRRQSGEHRAIEAPHAAAVSTAYGTTHDYMVRPPGMVCSQVAVGYERTGEVGEGE